MIISSSVMLKCNSCLKWFKHVFTRGCMPPDGIIILPCPKCRNDITMIDKGKVGDDIYDIEIQGAIRGLHLVWETP